MTANGEIKLNAYAVLSRAIAEGIEAGWNIAHKHNDDPSPDVVMDQIYRAVMNDLSEVIQWESTES